MRIHWREEFKSLLSLALFVAALAFVFQSWEIALIWASSLGVHEIGHILAISLSGIDWTMRFGPLGAYTETPLEERMALSHFRNSLIHLAGPFFSVLYALVALGVYLLLPGDSERLLRVANFSALVGLLNLLPMGVISDGGKFIKRVIVSLDHRGDKAITWLPVIWGMATVAGVFAILSVRRVDVAVIVLQTTSVLLIVVWLLAGMLLERRAENVGQSDSSLPMTLDQSRQLLLGMWIMLLTCTAILLTTPFWLNHETATNLTNRLTQISPAIFGGALFLLMVVVLMVAHEMGHYLVARWIGLPVRRIVIGRPASRQWRRLRLAGQDVEIYRGLPLLLALDVDDDALIAAGAWRRILFAASGPTVNFLLVMAAGWLATGIGAGTRWGLEFIASSFKLLGLFFFAPLGLGSSTEFFSLYAHLSGQAAAQGVSSWVALWMLLNGIVGAANAIPAPGLDGGLVFVTLLMRALGRGQPERAAAVFVWWYRIAPRFVAWLPWIFITLSVFHLVRMYLGA